MLSPTGFACRAVSHRGESVRPQPVTLPTGRLYLVDQLTIDIPRDGFEEECSYWAAITGWALRRSTVRQEFRYLERPHGSPLRVLLQQRDDNEGRARGHLDLAADDVARVVDLHQTLGAALHARYEHWTTMVDPAGFPYCITTRDPRTGVLGTTT
jgi:hypothetical protein